MSNDSTAIMADMELDDWEVEDGGDGAVASIPSLDSRRRVENKLDELRLRRETSEYDFDF